MSEGEPQRDTRRENINHLLKDHGIDINDWGKGAAKTFDHLISEIEEGATTLTTGEKGELLRRFKVVGVTVVHQDREGCVYLLREDRQEFKDGRVRKRDLDASIAEKMTGDEEPLDAARRAITEELDIHDEIKLEEKGSYQVVDLSASYPGLTSDYNAYFFEAVLNDEQFNPNGYIEEQDDKRTYFVWEKLE